MSEGVLRADAHVLAIVVARIGDTLLVTPALRALKTAVPRGCLTVLAHPKRMALLRHLPFIDRLGSITKRSGFWRARLPRARHDVAVVWGHDKPLIDYALRCSHAVVAFETAGMAAHPRLTQVAPPSASIHAVEERLLLAEAAGAARAGLRLDYMPTPEEREAARAWLAANGGGKPLVGIQPVSFPTKAHRDWPVDSFIELLHVLAQAHTAARFVVLGDAAATDSAEQLRKALGDKVIVAAGRFGLRESAALISCLDLYIGVDTGPTHIAGALGIPMVALYHCAYPGRNLAPLEHPALRMIEHPATGDGTATTERSMGEVPVAAVSGAALDLLGGAASR